MINSFNDPWKSKEQNKKIWPRTFADQAAELGTVPDSAGFETLVLTHQAENVSGEVRPVYKKTAGDIAATLAVRTSMDSEEFAAIIKANEL